MKWFLAMIADEKIHFDDNDIKKAIFEEYGLNVSANVIRNENSIFSLASYNSQLPTKNKFEDITILGDITIHNRKELINLLSENERVPIKTNEELIYYLYKNKGIKFVEELVGEFSLVLYDQKKKEAYAIRDQLGVKTLFWLELKGNFIFASDIFLLKPYFNFSRNSLNENYFRLFYYGNGVLDSNETPFKGIHRVPRGEYVKKVNKESSRYKYWELSNVKGNVYFPKRSDYLDEFRGILKKSVEDRLSKHGVNSIMLSGGLDSTSVYVLAKSIANQNSNLSLSTISAVFEELKDSDESEFIIDLLDKYEDKGNLINCDDVLMFESFPYNSPFTYEPNVSSITYEFTFHLIKKSRELGFTNILSGYAGDHLLSNSLYITRDYLGKGQIKKALQTVTDYSIQTNTSAVQNLMKYTLFPNVLNDYIVKGRNIQYKTLLKTMKKIKDLNQRDLYYQIFSANTHYLDRVLGPLAGVNLQHPFLDRRLIEFVYKIPGEIKYLNEYNKSLLRDAMRDDLTSNIANAINKKTHLAHTYKSIRKNWNEIYEIMYKPMIINQLDFVSTEEWVNLLGNWRNGVEVKDNFWTLFAIEAWFRKYLKAINAN